MFSLQDLKDYLPLDKKWENYRITRNQSYQLYEDSSFVDNDDEDVDVSQSLFTRHMTGIYAIELYIPRKNGEAAKVFIVEDSLIDFLTRKEAVDDYLENFGEWKVYEMIAESLSENVRGVKTHKLFQRSFEGYMRNTVYGKGKTKVNESSIIEELIIIEG